MLLAAAFAPELTAGPPLLAPPPGTPVAPIDVPAHVMPIAAKPVDKPADRRLVDSTTVEVDYRIDAVGPSGIGRVDVYLTADGGTTWIHAGQDRDRVSPAVVQFPGDGVFGIRLAIVNGNGFGGRPPRPGDRPQRTVEVDRTPPIVTLADPETVGGAPALLIRWHAEDDNLADRPIALYYRTPTDPVWRTIAANLDNVGRFAWRLPADAPTAVLLKVEAVDRAGNRSGAETRVPIHLDRIEPEATIVGAIATAGGAVVSASSLTPAPPTIDLPLLAPPATPASLPAIPSIPAID
jgi:hypothetical protein